MESSLSLHLEETDIQHLLRTSLAPLVAQANEESVELRVETVGAIPTMRIDREKLAWCVATLVGNALRYVKGTGGLIVVDVEADPESLTISVHDDGPGIPDHKLPYLFERRAGRALAEGLALMLVRDIVRAHRGRIEVESRRDVEEHGTSISLRLPLS